MSAEARRNGWRGFDGIGEKVDGGWLYRCDGMPTMRGCGDEAIVPRRFKRVGEKSTGWLVTYGRDDPDEPGDDGKGNDLDVVITEFVLARIAEDEEAARDAALSAGGIGYGEERISNGKTWDRRYHEVVRPVTDVTDRRTIADCNGFAGLSIAPHIARWDPARVLAECGAKRLVIEAAWNDQLRIEGEWGSGQSREQMEAANDIPPAVTALASVYAEHADYDPAWRP